MRCRSDALYCLSLNRGRGSMVELELPKLVTRVRFPSPAPEIVQQWQTVIAVLF